MGSVQDFCLGGSDVSSEQLHRHGEFLFNENLKISSWCCLRSSLWNTLIKTFIHLVHWASHFCIHIQMVWAMIQDYYKIWDILILYTLSAFGREDKADSSHLLCWGFICDKNHAGKGFKCKLTTHAVNNVYNIYSSGIFPRHYISLYRDFFSPVS